MEERIEEVTTITSDDDELPDDNNLEFQCARRVPFPEFGMDIIDSEQFYVYFSFGALRAHSLFE